MIPFFLTLFTIRLPQSFFTEVSHFLTNAQKTDSHLGKVKTAVMCRTSSNPIINNGVDRIYPQKLVSLEDAQKEENQDMKD
jgi:hypothetical protein